MSGLGELFGQLGDDLKALATAEVKLLKSRTFAVFKRSRLVIILLILAACVAFASLIALLLGFVLALAPVVGAAIGGLIVLAGGLAVATGLAWFAMRLFAGPDETSEQSS